MAVQKMMGIETEVAIFGPQTPEHAALALMDVFRSPLMAQYVLQVGRFNDHMPNKCVYLRNGGIFYIDDAHPEICTPESADALENARQVHATFLVLQKALDILNAGRNPPPYRIFVNNVDTSGKSWASHENFSIPKELTANRLADALCPFLASRIIYTGAGHVFMPNEDEDSWPELKFRISQRASHIVTETTESSTISQRGMIVDRQIQETSLVLRRLNVIVGESNMAQTATFLRDGATALVLAMIEDGETFEQLRFANNIKTLSRVSGDLTLKHTHQLVGGRGISAIDHQRQYLRAAWQYVQDGNSSCVGGEATAEFILSTWERTLRGLENYRDRDLRQKADSVAGRDPIYMEVDWINKLDLMERWMEAHAARGDDMKLGSLDFQFHELQMRTPFTLSGADHSLFSEHDLEIAAVTPPPHSRAQSRTRLLERFAKSSHRLTHVSWPLVGVSGPLGPITIELPDPFENPIADIFAQLPVDASDDDLLHYLVNHGHTSSYIVMGADIGPVPAPPTNDSIDLM